MSKPRLEWKSFRWVFRCSVRWAMRLESKAICTSLEPVSFSWTRFSSIILCLSMYSDMIYFSDFSVRGFCPCKTAPQPKPGAPLCLVPACLEPARGSPRRQPEIGGSLTQADESCRFSVPVQAETVPVSFPVAKLTSSLTIESPWTYPISPTVPT